MWGCFALKHTNEEVLNMAKCGETCEIFSRVTGYYRPVAAYNKGKQEEVKDRVMFHVGPEMKVSGVLGKHSK